jgi:hypothetical protein
MLCVSVIVASVALGGPLSSATAAGRSPFAGKMLVTRYGHVSQEKATLIMNPDGSGLRRFGWAAQDPTWSPIGDKVASWSNHDCDECGYTPPTLYVSVWDSETGWQSGLDEVEGVHPDWSPDGNELVYEYGPSRSPNDIYAIEASPGTTPRNLTNTPDVGEIHPHWSPTGDQIVYGRYGDEGPSLWLMNSDGSEQHVLTGPEAHSPSWSWDGTRIAYLAPDPAGDDYEIFTIRADGTHKKQRTFNEDGEIGPSWMVNDEGLLFSSYSARVGMESIYSFEFGDEDRRRLTCEMSSEADYEYADQRQGPFDFDAAGARRSPTRSLLSKRRGVFGVWLQAEKGPCEPPAEDCSGGRRVLLKKKIDGADRVIGRKRTSREGIADFDGRGRHGSFYAVAKTKRFTSPEGRKVKCLRARSALVEG